MLLAPFLGLALLIGLFVLIQIQAIGSVFSILGLSPRAALFALLVSLIGSYINIPLYTVRSGPAPAMPTANNLIPFEYSGPKTTVAINVGGAIVPIIISAYALINAPAAFLPSLLGTVIVALVTHHFAYPLPGVGIALPQFIPPLAAALVALFLGKALRLQGGVHVIAYVSGVLGTLIGADLSNLHRIADLGAPGVSIGGAGTFDGVFLTGIVAVLIAGF
jgi:uncharacterized membrane protein